MDKRKNRKVLLIGWDAADWKMINPLLDSGLMPTLEKFINEGVVGNIATMAPTISPILWNSIATGKVPHKHGVLGFVEPMPDGSGIRPAASTSRKCKALWNILTQAGLRSHVVGWFASHPAEPINGICVSNQFSLPPLGQKENWPLIPQSIHPEGAAKSLMDFRVHPLEISGDHLQPFLPRGAEIDQTSREEQKRLTALRKNMADCASVHAIATWLMENEPWDFMAIYYEAIDIIGHYFMPFHPPKMDGIGEKEFEIYKEVMTGIYRFHDMMLERLLQLAGPDTTVILVSDHGFYSDHLRPPVGSGAFKDPVSWHRSHGIIGMKGPDLLRDERIYGTTLVDIAPTVLTLFGLPIGEDMDGKVLAQAFKNAPKTERIASWETVPGEAGMHPGDIRQDPVAAQQAIQQLIDLGYVQAPSEDKQKAIQLAVESNQFNLGISLLHYGDPMEASKVFETLLAQKPGEKRFGYPLAQAYFKAGRLPDVRRVLESFLEKDAGSPAMQLMMGSLLLAEGRIEAAMEQLLNAEKQTANMPQLHSRLGSAYIRSRKWNEAERAFRRAMEIDGDNAEACYGLSVALMRKGKLEEAAEFALRSVGLQHHFAVGHFQLGVVLARLNQPARAAQALEHSLAMNPSFVVAHRYLARLYYRLGDLKKCYEHQQAITKLRADAKAAPAH